MTRFFKTETHYYFLFTVNSLGIYGHAVGLWFSSD